MKPTPNDETKKTAQEMAEEYAIGIADWSGGEEASFLSVVDAFLSGHALATEKAQGELSGTGLVCMNCNHTYFRHEVLAEVKKLQAQLSEKDAEIKELVETVKDLTTPSYHKRMTELRSELQAANARAEKILRLIYSLLNKVNLVTSQHRHGQPISEGMLWELSERQIDVEQALAAYSEDRKGGV